MAADPPAVTLVRQAPTTIISRLRLIRSIACPLALLSLSFITTPSISAFCETHPAFAIRNCHQRLHLKYFISRGNTLKISSMNKDSVHESEDTIQQPANKKMRTESLPSPTPDTTMTMTQAITKPKVKGTLYITVGPQCAGKTTVLKQIFGRSFHKNEEDVSASLTNEEVSAAGVDITIDDQALVYIPVPTSYFLGKSTSNNTPSPDTSSATYPSLNQKVLGKTIHERITDQSNEELVLVLQRLGGTLGAEEFKLRLQGSSGGAGGTNTAQGDLIDAVEEVLRLQSSSKLQTAKGDVNDQEVTATLPETIDLFIVESIFRPRPLSIMQTVSNGPTDAVPNKPGSSETLSALDQALHLIKTHATNPRIHAPTAPLSWGNTNTRPREFQSALEAAVSSGRPVEFIVFGGSEACEMIRMGHGSKEENSAAATNAEAIGEDENWTDEQRLPCLPKVDRQTLLVRNLQRLLRTGRYIPSNAIADAVVRVESLVASAVAGANKECSKDENNKSMTNAKFRLDFELANLAGYRLNADRSVSATRGSTSNASNGNTRDNRNHRSRNNNYQSGRGDNRNRQQPRRYDGGRGRNYGGRGGHSNSRSGNDWNQGRQEHGYNNQGRGYDQDHRQESGRRPSGGYYPTENGGRGNYDSSHGGQRFESSNGREYDGRGGNDRYRSSGDCDEFGRRNNSRQG